MGEEEPVKAESEASLVVTTPPKESPAEEKAPVHDPFEKALVPNPTKEVSPSKSPPTPEKVADPGVEKRSILDAIDRDAALAKVENEKKSALIKAWEDNEKTKADNKAYKKLSTIEAWENTERASVEAQLKQIEEKIEKKKAEYAEKMKNKMAEIHRAAEEKRAMVEAKRGEDFLKVEETAAKCRATGNIPKKLFGCFSC